MTSIREIAADEFSLLWPIFQTVITAGDTFAYPADYPEAEARASWATPPSRCFVLERDGEVLGGYMIRPNQPGHGAHVANAGYLVAPAARGQGFASQLCAHSLETARAAGYRSMQFNFVVSTNEPAVHLWRKHGFQILARLPEAFRHPTQGYVDAFLMHRFL
jgi:ribosomal protein S18 acetylase RimI-like enzyme